MALRIVTDSTSDIEPTKAQAWGVDVVPLFVVFGDRSYRDYLDLSRDSFYEKLASEAALPTTSQPTAAMFEEAFRPHIEAGDDILCLTIAQTLSGTINAARAAAQNFPDGRIHLFDSQTAAGGLQLQVRHALEMQRDGATLHDIVEALTSDRQSQRLYAVAPDLSHLVRTGRIGRAKAALGTLMKIVPVLRLKDGVVEAEAQVRTLSRAQETMVGASIRAIQNTSAARFFVMHTRAAQLAEQIARELTARLGSEPASLEIVEAGPVIATHAGAGAAGIFSVEWS